MSPDASVVIISTFVLIVAFCLFMVPTIIAFSREHHYRWVILVLNTIGAGALGIGWLVALIWAIWPKDEGHSE
jgi:hypothetical protein